MPVKLSVADRVLALVMTGIACLPVRVSDSFWISSRSRQKGLQYAVEGYIQNITIRNEGDTTILEAKAYRSQAKSEKPHDLYLKCSQHTLLDQSCSCTAG
ncbi:hypothetical protein AMECASPLE_033430 [Ameca splendens]|uniref:Uncharacterized protein n=1 Tax=Ameca splendens TaxID=208324 RepID=A0ABV0ZSP6_9TELE